MDTIRVVADADTPCSIRYMDWKTRTKKRMKELGIRQEDLLDAFGVTTRGAVGHYLSGRRTPSAEQLQNVATKLQMPIGHLLAGETFATRPVSQSDATTEQTAFPPDLWVPVQGAAVVDKDGYWETLEDLDSGHVLWNVAKPGAYAIEIRTDRYHPDLRRGVIAIFQPGMEPSFGEFALVKAKDGRRTILEFLRKDEGLYTFSSLVGGQRVTFDTSELLSVDAWIGTVPASQKRSNGVS